jgi:peptidoglycan/xylan/chitin deacetylase (PgdA/CDA1 family)
MSRYDFSRVPQTTPQQPANNAGVPPCVGTPAAEGSSGRCSWTCGNNCLRPNDVFTCPTRGHWALTFDDGPAPWTSALLDYLAAKDIRATFFVVGSRVREYPQILLRIFQEGHQIGIHTWSHRALTTQTTEQVVAELEYSILAIEQIIGTRPVYMRPPFGDFGILY